MDMTLKQARELCVKLNQDLEILASGSVYFAGLPTNERSLMERLAAFQGAPLPPAAKAPDPMAAPGYEILAAVLQRAFSQAAHGKGKERHAQAGERFEDQMMQDMARRFGVGALLSQAFKKSEESQRLPLDRGVNELLGAIVYLAGAVIARERAEAAAPPAANDNPTSRGCVPMAVEWPDLQTR